MLMDVRKGRPAGPPLHKTSFILSGESVEDANEVEGRRVNFIIAKICPPSTADTNLVSLGLRPPLRMIEREGISRADPPPHLPDP
jgi:hypothetical protein